MVNCSKYVPGCIKLGASIIEMLMLAENTILGDPSYSGKRSGTPMAITANRGDLGWPDDFIQRRHKTGQCRSVNGDSEGIEVVVHCTHWMMLRQFIADK